MVDYVVPGMIDSSAGALSNRNKIINGAMVIDQRNAGASVTPTDGAYTLDRWNAGLTQASKFTIQQSSTAVTGFVNSLLVTSTSAYSVGAADLFRVSQYIEGLNILDLAWGTANAATITLSFWVRSSLTGTFSGSLMNSAMSRSYPFTYTINSANTFEYKTVTIVGDTSGTWLTTNGIGIRVGFNLGAGSSFSASAGAWAAGTYTAATNTQSIVGTNGATFYITGVQLERGSVATAFEYRNYQQELAMCHRYFEVIGKSDHGLYAIQGSNGNGWWAAVVNVPMVFKRAIPTVSVVGTILKTSDYNVPAVLFTGQSAFSFGSYSTGATGGCAWWTDASNYFTASAEL